VPRELLRKMGENGYLCADVPDTYGGPGASVPFSFAVVEVLSRRGYGGFVGGLQVHNDIIPPYLLHCGTEAQRAHWLPRMASGEAIAAIGMTEPGAGSDLKAIRTTARRVSDSDGDHYVINGSKIFISNGQNCDLLVLAAKTDPAAGAKGVSLFLVDTPRPASRAARTWKKSASTRATPPSCSSTTCACRQMPCSAAWKAKGFVQMMRELPRERLIIGVQAVHGAKGALDATLKYVQERQAFGQPIGQFQNTRFTLAQCASRHRRRRGLPERQRGRLPAGPAHARGGERAQAAHHRAVQPRGRCLPATLRRLRLHGRIPHLALLDRRARAAHLRRHVGDHERAGGALAAG
jgi:acyl-CoA dehydrogenase